MVTRPRQPTDVYLSHEQFDLLERLIGTPGVPRGTAKDVLEHMIEAVCEGIARPGSPSGLAVAQLFSGCPRCTERLSGHDPECPLQKTDRGALSGHETAPACRRSDAGRSD